jgi:hypothetical protein
MAVPSRSAGGAMADPSDPTPGGEGVPDWREPTDGEIERAADGIITGEPADRLGANVREVSAIGDPGRIPEPKLRLLHEYWQELCTRHAGRPDRGHVDVLSILPAAGNVMLLDCLRQGYDARYRVYGTGIADFAGRDWTGATVSEMNAVTRTSLALMYRACYRAVARTGTPLYTQHDSPPWISARSWRRLILPLFARDGACSGFLVGNIPVAVRHLDRTERALQEAILGAPNRD